MGESFFEAIEELERMRREPSDVLEEMNDRLSARELQLVLVYFSQEGRDSWCALEVFEWLRKENRVDKETMELMVSIMCGWLKRLAGNYRDSVKFVIQLRESGLKPEVYSYLIAMTAVVKELNELGKALRKLKALTRAGLVAEFDSEDVGLIEKYQSDLLADGLQLSNWVIQEGSSSLCGVVHERLLAMETNAIARLLTRTEVSSSLCKKKSLSWLLRGYIKGGHFDDAAETVIKMLDLGLFPEYLDRAAVLHGLRKRIQQSDMRALKFLERFTSTQVHALNPVETSTGKTHGGVSRAKLNSQLLKPFGSNSKLKSFNSSVSVTEALLLPHGLPNTDLIEPSIEPHLKPIDFVEILADLYRRLESCESQSDRSLLFVEQYSLLRSLGDPKLLRRCLRAARQNAVDVNTKVVLSAWLRFERREDELSGMSAMDCGGQVLECPKIALEYGFDPNLISTHCHCDQDQTKAIDVPSFNENECVGLEQEESNVTFCIDNEEINCLRGKIAMLSSPLKAMLYGSFKESRKGRIDFSENGISVKGNESCGSV
ncbi:hypothetical protein J5N97_000396 [Dioscorea zingiberensis]|uniref:Pentatricopeptide repeat-containing protein n=1 Tax=Dioscorea zingiberensis TaxID=325984 RepID=A0A9D5H1G7_9LILI|nr:hypothetical protein J5N97_000396 [Dioscorea zingiberensis]